jgi:hypothetical protein
MKNKLILCLELSFVLILLSCISNDYKREFKLVKSIIDKPNEIRSIIRDSEFYDSTLIDLERTNYITEINYLKRVKNFSFKCYMGSINRNGITFTNIKTIEVYNNESEYAIVFSFKEVDKKWKFFETAFLKKY